MNVKGLLVVLAVPCLGMGAARADVVTDWNEKAVALVASRAMLPAAAERVVTMTQVAMFDAVNSVQHRYRPYLVQITPGSPVSEEAAAATAAATVLAGAVPDASADFKSALTAYLVGVPEGEAKTGGIRLGEAVATKVLEARQRWRKCPGRVSRQNPAWRLYSHTYHRVIDVAKCDAVCD